MSEDRVAGVEDRLDRAEQRFDAHVVECTQNGRRILDTLDLHAEERRRLAVRVEHVHSTLLVAIEAGTSAQSRRLNRILVAIIIAILSVLGDVALRLLSPDMLVIILERMAGH